MIWFYGDNFKAIGTKSDENSFLIALTQLGVLYIVALFIERAVEVLIKAWRQGGKASLIQKRNSNLNDTHQIQNELEEYRAGTQRRALLAAMTLGIFVSMSGVRILGPIFSINGVEVGSFQSGIFQFTDIVITAGLIAGGSKTIHELMALIDYFLKTSRKNATQESNKLSPNNS